MGYDWVGAYCLAKPGVEKDYKQEWEAARYLVGGKLFLMDGGDRDGTPILTLKLAPEFGDLLRQTYPGEIVPGYYMNKVHWNSLYRSAKVPDEVVRDMLDQSYRLVLESLPKRARDAILNQG